MGHKAIATAPARENRLRGPYSALPLAGLAAAALLSAGAALPVQCVSRERVEACEAACGDHGGYEWVSVPGAGSWDCLCRDLTALDIEGDEAWVQPFIAWEGDEWEGRAQP